MSTAPPRLRLRRGDERIEVAIVGSTLTTGRNEVLVVQWPSQVVLERIEAGKMKVARQRFDAAVAALTAAGFAPAADEWVLPAREPEPEPDPLRPHERRVGGREARLLIPPLLQQVVDLDTVDHVVIHEGDLHATTFSVSYPRGAMWIRGDLRVEEDVDDWEGAVLLVDGELTCRSARLRGAFACGGDLNAREFVYVNSGNDQAFLVGGTLHSKVFVECGMASYAERFAAEVWRTMNVVATTRDGVRVDLPRIARSAISTAHLASLGLGPDAVLELTQLLGLPEA